MLDSNHDPIHLLSCGREPRVAVDCEYWECFTTASLPFEWGSPDVKDVFNDLAYGWHQDKTLPNVNSLTLHAILPGAGRSRATWSALFSGALAAGAGSGKDGASVESRGRDMMSRRGSGPFEFLRWRVTSDIPKADCRKQGVTMGLMRTTHLSSWSWCRKGSGWRLKAYKASSPISASESPTSTEAASIQTSHYNPQSPLEQYPGQDAFSQALHLPRLFLLGPRASGCTSHAQPQPPEPTRSTHACPPTLEISLFSRCASCLVWACSSAQWKCSGRGHERTRSQWHWKSPRSLCGWECDIVSNH
jgi:hypothetical protein